MKTGPRIKPIHGAYPEFTWVAIIVGWAIGAVITVSVAYASLVLGFSIEGSELAAILGWGILRGVLRRTSIVENNINQTIASAVNGASSGIMFSVPALLILSKQEQFAELADINQPLLILAAITGCVLGLCFVIPLRKQMIDFDRLPYPGGIAVATILKSPGAGVRKAVLLLSGVGLAAICQLLVLWGYQGGEPAWAAGSQLGLPSMLNITFFISIMTIGVGYLSGKGGFWFGAGGFVCYFILSPLLSLLAGADVASLTADPDGMRLQLYRPTGIGMLIGAAIGGIIGALPMILSAMGALRGASERSAGSVAEKDELPIWMLYLMIAVGSILVVGIAWYVGAGQISLGRALLMAALGIGWIWVAGVIVAECIGRTNWSPLSGMTLIAVTLLIIALKGSTDTLTTIRVSMIVGAAVCLAVSQASDIMLDLKSGYLVGGVPRRQQLAQFVGTWLGPIIVVWLMMLLHGAKEGGMGSESLPAPQAQALATTIESIVSGNVPAYRYTAGAGMGFMLALSGLGGIGVLVGLGFYMPFHIVLTYTLGNILRVLSDRTLGKRFGFEVGVPIAAGLIVGEALVNVGDAVWQILFP
ncbi:MAG: OPT/YSL family transporter [Planctomycetales bacterium]|nr:OPT/YSL family transporter [Planctomycetales bacterium]